MEFPWHGGPSCILATANRAPRSKSSPRERGAEKEQCFYAAKMGDVRDILRGGAAISDVMSQSHPAPDSRQLHSPTSSDPWRWTEYKSKYRPFSQYSYSAGSWHRNQPLDTTDGPSSWYAEVAERIHKAEEYKTRSRSSGIGETDYPSERNRLIWSNSVSALTLHDTVDSAAGHRRQKSRFHSLGPAFPLAKDSKPSSAASGGSGSGRSTSKARTSRSVSRRRVADGAKPPTQGASPMKSTAPARAPSKTPPKKDGESKEGTKDSKPRAVVKPTPAKEDKAKQDDKKWIKPSANDTIEKEKDKVKSPSPGAAAPKETKEIKPAAAANTPISQTTTPKPVAEPAKSEGPKAAAAAAVDEKRAAPAATAAGEGAKKENAPLKKEEPAQPAKPQPAQVAETPKSAAVEPPKAATSAAAPPVKAAPVAPAASVSPAATAAPAASVTSAATTTTPANLPKSAQPEVAPTAASVVAPTPASVASPAAVSPAPSAAPHSASASTPAPAAAAAVSPAIATATAATVPVVQQKATPIDPMAQSFIDTSTIGGGGGVKAAPKPGDFSLARSRLDEFWAEGK